jgi:hypothetical protein
MKPWPGINEPGESGKSERGYAFPLELVSQLNDRTGQQDVKARVIARQNVTQIFIVMMEGVDRGYSQCERTSNGDVGHEWEKH